MGTGYRVIVCTVLLLGCLVGGVIVVGGTPDTDDGVVDRPVGGQEEPSLSGYDELRYEVDLRDDGSASWTVEYRYRLDDDNESVDWADLQDDVEQRPDRYLESFESDVRADVTEAENETGREMLASDFAIETDETSTAPEYGYVRISFEWDSFAHVELNRIEAGDALGWLELDERVVFDVAWPEEYSETTIEPAPDDRRETAVIWHGEETEFRDGEPEVEVMDTGGEPVDAGEQPDRFYTLPWLVVGAVVLTVAGVGWWVTRGGQRPLGSTEPTRPESGTQPDRPPPELLSNEERVLCLIEDRGGRIKQQEVVSELEWTEAKTSQVVGQLREDGEIEVFRIGRENVLALPDDDD